MTAWGWIAVGGLGAVIAWLGLALTGAVRELTDLRARVTDLEAARGRDSVRLADGLPVGASEPAWTIDVPGGSPATSVAWRGRRHLVLFADADCAACVDLLPDLLGAAADALVPPTVVVGRGPAPAAWAELGDGVRVVVGSEGDRSVSRSFRTEISPHLFVIDEGGFVAAQGGPLSLEDVHALVREAGDLRIISGSLDG